MTRLRMVYYDAGIVEDERDLYHVGLLIAYSLLLSNSIRRDTTVIVDMRYKSIATRLTVDGRKVRHLRMDAASLTGFVRKALRGRIRGVSLSSPTPLKARLCLYAAGRPSIDWDASTQLVCPAIRGLKTIMIVLVDNDVGMVSCRYRVACNVPLEKVWLKAAVIQLMLDRWL